MEVVDAKENLWLKLWWTFTRTAEEVSALTHTRRTFLQRMSLDLNYLNCCFTSQHESSDTLSPALHGSLHQGCETVTVSPLDVQPREVVEQVVRDDHVTCRPERNTDRCYAGKGFSSLALASFFSGISLIVFAFLHFNKPFSVFKHCSI